MACMRSIAGAEPSREPASGRAALAYLRGVGRRRPMRSWRPVLGVSRAESVPNLTRRFGAWLATDAGVREQLRCLEEELDGPG